MSQAQIDIANDYQIQNFLRLEQYLKAPAVNSPYAPNDSLATRGATYQLLRYALDQSTGTNSSYLHALVSTSNTGDDHAHRALDQRDIRANGRRRSLRTLRHHGERDGGRYVLIQRKCGAGRRGTHPGQNALMRDCQQSRILLPLKLQRGSPNNGSKSIPVLELPFEHRHGQRILHQPLNRPLERARAE